MYNVSASTLQVRRRIEWNSSESDIKMCRLKGKDEAACHNYIRVIAKKAHDRVLICGTNAYKPKCRDYVLVPSGGDGHQNAEFSLTEEKPGEGLCPYDPNHNSTFTFAGMTSRKMRLYATSREFPPSPHSQVVYRNYAQFY